MKIEGPMSIYEVTDLREAMLEHFRETGGFVLDLAAVDACDTAGVQLLCSARVSARRKDRPFKVLAASDAVIDAIRGIGLSPSELLD